MSLHKAAKHLAAKGRGPDTMLVHMAPGEVAGLQALAKTAGGSLTLNPDTGLPEAGFLSNLLPTIIGAGVTAFTGGAAAPWMIGAGVGGLQALRTGSLTKGLSAGLGAYGGAGLTGGLADMGATALARGAGAAIPQTTVDEFGNIAANPAYAAGPTPSYGDRLRAGAGTFEWNKPMDFVRGLGGGDTKRGAMMIGAAALPTVMDVLAPQQSTRLGGGDGAMPQRMRYDTATGRYVPISQQTAKGIYGFAEGGIAAGMPEWNPKWMPDTPGYGNQGQNFGREILYYDMNLDDAAEEEKKAEAAPVELRPEDTGGHVDGGDYGGGGAKAGTAFNSGNNYTGIPAALWGKSEAETANTPVVDLSSYSPDTWGLGFDAAGMDTGGGVAGLGGVGGYGGSGTASGGFGGSDAFGGFAAGGMSGYAAGGLGSLGSYSDGGRLLRGPGDGVSDSIPATIGHKRQPARLADGEFVVPARIVSELGNGSTEAGARKLYAMMDRIQANRKKSVGKGRVAVNAKSDRHLPA